jgi:hypothetical protein
LSNLKIEEIWRKSEKIRDEKIVEKMFINVDILQILREKLKKNILTKRVKT